MKKKTAVILFVVVIILLIDSSFRVSNLQTQLDEANRLLSENERLSEQLESEAERITLVDEIDKENMSLYWQYIYYPKPRPENAWKYSIYTSAGKTDNGEFGYDDGQEWMMVVETPSGYYPLVPRKYIQLGGISCTIFFDNNQKGVLNVLVTEQWGASHELSVFSLSDTEKAFMVEPIRYFGNICVLANSKGIMEP